MFVPEVDWEIEAEAAAAGVPRLGGLFERMPVLVLSNDGFGSVSSESCGG